MKIRLVKYKYLVPFLVVFFVACSQKTVEEYIASAQSYLEKNDKNSAVLEFKNAIVSDPNSIIARVELGKTYLLIGENTASEKELEKALKLGADKEDVWPYLIQAKAYLKKSDELIEIANLTVEKQEVNANSERTLFYAGRELLQGDATDAELGESFLNYLVANAAKSDYGQLAQAWLDFGANNIVATESIVDPILARLPDFAEAVELKALVAEVSGRNAEAVKFFLQYLKIRPFEADKRIHLAHNQILFGHTEDAKRELESLLKVNKADPVSNMLYASVKFEEQDFEQAMQYAELSLLSAPSLKKSRIIAGLSAYELNHVEQSYNHLNKVAKDLPSGHRASKILQLTRIRMGHLDESIEQMKNADAIDVDMYATNAMALLQQNDKDQAQDLLNVIKDSEISDQVTLSKRGILKLSLQDDSGFADLEKAVSEVPENDKFWELLISQYIAAKMFDKAEVQIKQWLLTSPDNDNALAYQGTVYLYQENESAALASFKRALEINDENTSSLLNLALLDVRSKDYKSAVEYFERLLLLRPDHFLAMMHLQKIAQSENNIDLAIVPINRVLEKHPNNLSLFIGLGRIYDAFGQPDKALSLLSKISEESKTKPAYIAFMGAIYVSKGQYKAAEDTYQKLIALVPNLPTPYKRLILVHELMLDYVSGLAVASRAADKFSDDSYFLLMEGYFNVMMNKHEKAKKIVATLERKRVESPILDKIKGKIATIEGDVETSIESYYKIYRNNPKEINVLNLAKKLNYYNKSDEASKLLEKHLKTNGGSDLVRALLAEFNFNSNPQRAIELYKEINSSHPNNVMVLNNLAQMYLSVGNIDEAINYAEMAFDIEGTPPQVKDTLGYALLKKGDVKKALPLLKEAAAVSQDPLISLHYGEALIIGGEKTLAQSLLNKIKTTNQQQAKFLEELNQRLK